MVHMMVSRKIVIPGGAGLVGQNLIAHMKNKGFDERNIYVIDKHKKNLDILKRMHKSINCIEADLAEHGSWEDTFQNAECVVQLQAQIGGLTIDPFIRNNILSTENVISAIKKYNVPYLIHFSSSVVNSVADDFYTNTKKKQEELVKNSGVKHIILRPTLMFGWFDRKHLGWLSRFMHKTPIFPIPGNGKFMRQPLYASDISDIVISCIASNKTGEYNISGQEKVDYIDIIREIKKVTESHTLIVCIPYSLFYFLLKAYSLFDKDPPFTTQQLAALVAHDEFEVIDWPSIFNVKSTPFNDAIRETFTNPKYSHIVLEF